MTRDRHPRRARGRARRLARATRRDRQGAGHVPVLVRPRRRRRAVGRHPALAAPVRPDRADRRVAGVEDRGVEAVITADDVPGKMTYGLIDARPAGVRLATSCATSASRSRPSPPTIPETCRRALAAIVVEYEVLEPVLDPEAVIAGSTQPIHPDGNVLRHQRIIRGDPSRHRRRRRSRARTEIGMQDQAFLGLEAALAIPDPGGAGVELHIATQWLHEDRKQIAACLGLPEEQVRLVLAGVGGAFGAREDISLQVHTCLLALRLGRPVRMQYSRAESFLGHVHRHPATIWMRHHATADGEIVKIEARFVFDGGAYASTSSAVLLNAITHTQGPYRCPNAVVEGWAIRTNHLPCGAMRGFGVVQACFAHESQLDLLAEACGLDPVEIRVRNAIRTGDRLITGQVLRQRGARSSAASARPRRCRSPTSRSAVTTAIRCACPAVPAAPPTLTTSYRGIGYAAAMKNLMYSEGFDDYSTARCRLADGVVTTQVRHVRGRPGLRHDRPPDRPRRARRRRGRARPDRHRGRLGRFVVGLAPDLDERRCRATPPASPSASGCSSTSPPTHGVADRVARASTAPTSSTAPACCGLPVAEASAGHRVRRDPRVPPSAHRGARRERPGRLPHGVRLRRPPRGRRRRRRPRAGEGRAGRHRPGRRPRAQPAVGRRPGRGRDLAGSRPGGDGGDRADRRPDPQRQLHRLPAADDARHAAGRDVADRGARAAGAARRQGRRGAALHLVDAGDRGRDPRRPPPGRARADRTRPRARAPDRHRRSGDSEPAEACPCLHE